MREVLLLILSFKHWPEVLLVIGSALVVGTVMYLLSK